MKFIRIVLVTLLSSSLVLLPVTHAAELALPSGDLTVNTNIFPNTYLSTKLNFL